MSKFNKVDFLVEKHLKELATECDSIDQLIYCLCTMMASVIFSSGKDTDDAIKFVSNAIRKTIKGNVAMMSN